MAWWVLTYLYNDRAQTSLAVLAATNHPAHLMMAWATYEPARRPIYRIVRGARVFCGWKYIWDTPNLVEQTQPLDTFEHIFVTTPLKPPDHVWYYLFSTKKLYERYCQSPLIHVPPPEIQMASARIFHSVNQPVPTHNFTTLTFDSVLWDDYHFYDPADPTKLTFPAGGLYDFGFCGRLTTIAAAEASLEIRLNATTTVLYHSHNIGPTGWGGAGFSLHSTMRFQPADFLQCRIYHTEGIAREVVATPLFSPHFWVRLVGAYPLSPPW